METLLYIFAGAGVGFAVGLTGVGGGSLMTPILLLFGFPTYIAIGTDLVYASITKAGGVLSHSRQSTIQWKLVSRLAAGSIPGSLITIYALKHFFGNPESYQNILLTTLGIMLILTSMVLLFKRKIKNYHAPKPNPQSWLLRHRNTITLFIGAILGVGVTLSSVGAGAFGAAVLLILYPELSSIEIIGTDIAHAVPLTLIAGLGHMQLGNVDYTLLGSLLIGSLPAIHLGTIAGKRLPDKILQPTLASILFVIGVRYAFF